VSAAGTLTGGENGMQACRLNFVINIYAGRRPNPRGVLRPRVIGAG